MSDSSIGNSSPEKEKRRPSAGSSHPKMYDMLMEAVNELNERKGVSVPAIKSYITDKYKTFDQSKMKHLLKKALEKALELGTLVRVKTPDGATGRHSLMFCILDPLSHILLYVRFVSVSEVLP